MPVEQLARRHVRHRICVETDFERGIGFGEESPGAAGARAHKPLALRDGRSRARMTNAALKFPAQYPYTQQWESVDSGSSS